MILGAISPKPLIASIALAFLLPAAAADPKDDLKGGSAPLWSLYERLPQYRVQMTEYAEIQGFRRPYEQLATVVHELIHIDSVIHQGYFIDGVYYEPYLRPGAWPSITNKDVGPQMRDAERGLIYTAYVLGAPGNTMGNVLDEINAYGHVMGFVCHYEPESAPKQIENMKGFLALLEAYLRVVRVQSPNEYADLAAPGPSRGALELITRRAWNALRGCGVPDKDFPRAEVLRLTVGPASPR